MPSSVIQRGADLAIPELSLLSELGTLSISSCSNPVSAKQFFADCPWLSIPAHRSADILIEPLYPRGGLLGGASRATPKMSKLATLAAARKKKENERPTKEPAKSGSNSVALLDKLGTKIRPDNSSSLSESAQNTQESQAMPSSASTRRYPSRKKPPSPDKPTAKHFVQLDESFAPKDESVAPRIAMPSLFALTMLGSAQDASATSIPNTKYNAFQCFSDVGVPGSNPFAGPSPDDIVSNAQSRSKGLGTPKSSKNSKEVPNGLSNLPDDMSKVAITEGPRPKSKNINVVEEYNKSKRKKAANFVVIGWSITSLCTWLPCLRD